ncbi:caspase-1-like [Penaeus indicus]|uniref:caspase-1-like n=1 Tax=Penaeus indicus TaxID=29960 RepID=UPI00300D8AF4
MSSAVDSARVDGGNQGKANTTENRGAEGEEPAKDLPKERRTAYTEVDGLSERYPMNRRPRGVALIFAHSEFDNEASEPRPSAAYDAEIARAAFEALGFLPEVFLDLTKDKLEEKLLEVSERDHSSYDAFVIVFMSHGGIDFKKKEEFLWVKDDKILTKDLWKYFTSENCTSLAGKPKLYFIQACRGDRKDKGVSVSRRSTTVYTDSVDEYILPNQADQLIMWASYPGYEAYRPECKEIQGSVFIHYLAKNLMEYANTSPRTSLFSILLKVSREVAVLYETDKYDQKKQVPSIMSTLLREIYF